MVIQREIIFKDTIYNCIFHYIIIHFSTISYVYAYNSLNSLQKKICSKFTTSRLLTRIWCFLTYLTKLSKIIRNDTIVLNAIEPNSLLLHTRLEASGSEIITDYHQTTVKISSKSIKMFVTLLQIKRSLKLDFCIVSW